MKFLPDRRPIHEQLSDQLEPHPGYGDLPEELSDGELHRMTHVQRQQDAATLQETRETLFPETLYRETAPDDELRSDGYSVTEAPTAEEYVANGWIVHEEMTPLNRLAAGIKETAEFVVEPARQTVGLVQEASDLAAKGLGTLAEWAHNAGKGMNGAVDRADEALKHEKALRRSQKTLKGLGTVFGTAWKRPGQYFTERSERISHMLQNADAAKQNEKAIRRGAKGMHVTGDTMNWIKRKVERFSDLLDRTRVA